MSSKGPGNNRSIVLWNNRTIVLRTMYHCSPLLFPLCDVILYKNLVQNHPFDTTYTEALLMLMKVMMIVFGGSDCMQQ